MRKKNKSKEKLHPWMLICPTCSLPGPTSRGGKEHRRYGLAGRSCSLPFLSYWVSLLPRWPSSTCEGSETLCLQLGSACPVLAPLPPTSSAPPASFKLPAAVHRADVISHAPSSQIVRKLKKQYGSAACCSASISLSGKFWGFLPPLTHKYPIFSTSQG